MKPSSSKSEKIRGLKAPRSAKELRQLLGIVNYYMKYIPRMAMLAEPLHALLKKGRSWRWGPAQQKGLDQIKREIGRDETLAPFETNGKVRTYLTTDASENGIGAVLEQEQANGEIKPVVYWSSKLRSYEKNYSIS